MHSLLYNSRHRIMRMSDKYKKTPFRDIYNQQADTLFSSEHDESLNIGPYQSPSPDLYSPATSMSPLSETHFSPASPTGYMRVYKPPSPDLYSPSPLFVAESVDADFQPEDKRVVMEDEATTGYSPLP
ncbi:hypothetical protein XENORESO_019844 [Xenotaenia resolanae]|uniref:Brain-enriched guanylate kinase-associated protein n=1 Tax=Xenotaenia resolanae TaxID=208358 RepID=A0ABV0W249_9TELE